MASHLELVRVASPPSIPLEMTADMRKFVGMMSRRKRGKYTEDYADTMSLAVFLISLAVSVYFAEFIRAVIPINLLLLLILVHIVYVLIRWYVKGCMRSRGYY